MKDPTLQRVLDSREAISRRCDFDAHKLVRFCQSRQKVDKGNEKLRQDPNEHELPHTHPCS